MRWGKSSWENSTAAFSPKDSEPARWIIHSTHCQQLSQGPFLQWERVTGLQESCVWCFLTPDSECVNREVQEKWHELLLFLTVVAHHTAASVSSLSLSLFGPVWIDSGSNYPLVYSEWAILSALDSFSTYESQIKTSSTTEIHPPSLLINSIIVYHCTSQSFGNKTSVGIDRDH